MKKLLAILLLTLLTFSACAKEGESYVNPKMKEDISDTRVENLSENTTPVESPINESSDLPQNE